jgi:hypothetical protein
MKPDTPTEAAARLRPGASPQARLSQRKVDPMRRFVSTPHVALLPVMGRTVRLETNSSKLLEHMVDLFAGYAGVSHLTPEFLWRIVLEFDVSCRPPWPLRSTFSDEGIRYAQFGQGNFIAVDIEARETIAFVSEELFDDAPGFTSPFIDTLFYMNAAPLGLMPFASACISSGKQGLLVLGGPNQGKTTASYLAMREGLTIHADQSLFLELVGEELRAWGDFVPLAFRQETLQFLPELRSQTHPFSYCDFRFHYLPKPQRVTTESPFVTPTCCVVLERGTAVVPRLERLETLDGSRRIAGHIAFRDETVVEDQQQRILAALSKVPVYRLAYGRDPREAVPFFRGLLTRPDSLVQSA